MTIQNTTRMVTYSTPNGVIDTFPYSFKVTLESQLVVSVIVDATGVETTKSLTTDYTVTGVGLASGGTIVFETASIPVTGETVKIQRVVALTQLTDLKNQGSYKPQTQEDALDLLMMAIQQVNEAISAATELTEYTTASRPAASASWKNMWIAVRDATGPTRAQICLENATDDTYDWKDGAEGWPW